AAVSDSLAVDVGPVQTAEIAHADMRRVDVEHTMLAGDIQVLLIVGYLQQAVAAPANEAYRTVAEGVFPTFPRSVHDRQRHFFRHGLLLSPHDACTPRRRDECRALLVPDFGILL